MEYVIIIVIIFAYSGISSKIEKLNKKINSNFKTKKNLKEFIDKNVVITLTDDYFTNPEGIFKSYDDIWFELEKMNKNKKEISFYRIDDIETITLNEK